MQNTINTYDFNYDKETKAFWTEGESYTNFEDAFTEALKKAIRDLTTKTEKRSNNISLIDTIFDINTIQEEGENFFQNKSNKFFERLKLYESFLASVLSQKNFDEFHHLLCQQLHAEIIKIYPSASYGKSQKLVNMTFKYMYCSGFIKNLDTDKRTKLFGYCHMALDSITLEWIYRYIYPYYKIENNKLLRTNNCKASNLTKSRTPCWSKITNDDNCLLIKNDKYTYAFFTKLLQDYFSNINITPFQAEFIIWREMQMELAAEKFYNSLLKYYGETPKNVIKLDRHLPITDKLGTIKSYLLDRTSN